MIVTHKSFHLRHYGAPQYLTSKFTPIKDRQWIKPTGGLWTSPIDSLYGWKDWCKENDFGDTSQSFDIDFEGNVLTIEHETDLHTIPWSGAGFMGGPLFESMINSGVDAVHLTVGGQERTRFSYPRNLYGWDCETVLVMNPECLSMLVRT